MSNDIVTLIPPDLFASLKQCQIIVQLMLYNIYEIAFCLSKTTAFYPHRRRSPMQGRNYASSRYPIIVHLVLLSSNKRSMKFIMNILIIASNSLLLPACHKRHEDN